MNFKNAFLGFIFFSIFSVVVSLVIIFFAYKNLSIAIYPNLNSCFKTSISKRLLCSTADTYVRLNDISQNVSQSVINSEDDKFYLHKGFDWKEFKMSIESNLRALSFVRGGSTITQQLVKNIYLTAEKSISRKVKEAILAYQIERKYSKSIILEKYLNIIELGKNIWGVKEASLYYFSKPASELNPLEGAYLAVLLPNPKSYSSSYDNRELTPYLKKRIKKILYWRKRKGEISEEDYTYYLELIDFFPWTDTNFEDAESYGSDIGVGSDADSNYDPCGKTSDDSDFGTNTNSDINTNIRTDSNFKTEESPKIEPTSTPKSKASQNDDIEDPNDLDYLEGIDDVGTEEYIEN